jgi:hypothetical protein
MSVQLPINRKSIFEGTDVKVRHIEISPELKKVLKMQRAYREKYDKITPEEINELPEGAVTYPINALHRTVSGCTSKHHCQLIHYHQPLLGNKTTANILREIRESAKTNNQRYLPLKSYIESHFARLCEYFPYAFQVAYDIYTTGTLSDRAKELEKRLNDRYAEIEQLIDQEEL